MKKFLSVLIISSIVISSLIITGVIVYADDVQNMKLNNKNTVTATLEGEVLTISGAGDIDKNLWNNLRSSLGETFWKNSSAKIVFEDNGNSSDIYFPKDSRGLFSSFRGSIAFNKRINTSKATVMDSLFTGCINVTNLDVADWDTSNVTSMGALFNGCRNLRDIDVSKWNTSKVKNIGHIFRGAPNSNPDVSKWDVSKVTSMQMTFSGVYTPKLDLSSWDTSRVTTIEGMFRAAHINELDLSNFDASNVRSIAYLFNGFKRYDENGRPDGIKGFKNWDVSKVNKVFLAFSGADIAPDIINWNLSAPFGENGIAGMFGNNKKIRTIVLNLKDNPNVTMPVRAGKKDYIFVSGTSPDILSFNKLHEFEWKLPRTYTIELFNQEETEVESIYQCEKGERITFLDNRKYRLYDPSIKKRITFSLPAGDNVTLKKKGAAENITANEDGSYSLGFGDYSYTISGTHDKQANFEVIEDMDIVVDFDDDVEQDDIIPSNNGNNLKPADYITVEFKSAIGATLTGETIYYVNPYKKKRLRDITCPKVSDILGYENVVDASGTIRWNKTPSTILDTDIEVTALQKPMAIGGGVYYKYDNPKSPSKVILFGRGGLDKDKWDAFKSELKNNPSKNTMAMWDDPDFTIEFMPQEKDHNIRAFTDCTDMFSYFKGQIYFNRQLNTSSVTNMNRMLRQCPNFNSDISDWDVSKVKNMNSMFQASYSFNSDISSWDTSSLEKMGYMFDYAMSFNQDISGWNTAKVNRVASTFRNAKRLKKVVLLNRDNRKNTLAQDFVSNNDRIDVLKFTGLKDFSWTPNKAYVIANITNPTNPTWINYEANTAIKFNDNDEYHVYSKKYFDTKKIALQFNVTSDGNPLAKAAITLREKDATETMTTSDDEFDNIAGFKTYTYAITKDGYISQSGEITVEDEDKTIDIVLIKKKSLTLEIEKVSHRYNKKAPSDTDIRGTAKDGDTTINGSWHFVTDLADFVNVGKKNSVVVQFVPDSSYNGIYKDAAATVIVEIIKKDLTLNSLTAEDRVYEQGNNEVNLSCGELIGICEGDTVRIASASATLGDDSAGDKIIDKADINLSLDGEGKENYNLVNWDTDLSVTITKKDAPTLINHQKQYKVPCKASSEHIDLANISVGIPSDAGATTYSTNTEDGEIIRNIQLSEEGVLSYDIDSAKANQSYDIAVNVEMQNYKQATFNVNISTINKEIPNISAENYEKVYDNELITLDSIEKSNNGIDSEFSFVTDMNTVKSAGKHPVSIKFIPSEEFASDYAETTVSIEVNISPKDLTVTGIKAVDRDYIEGNTTVKVLRDEAVLSGAIKSDDVDFEIVGSGEIADDNVQNEKVVSINLKLTGDDKSNYALSNPSGITVSILPSSLPVKDGEIKLKAKYGTKLSDIENLTTYSPDYDIRFDDDSIKLQKSGDNSFKVMLHPKGEKAANYVTTEVLATVTVERPQTDRSEDDDEQEQETTPINHIDTPLEENNKEKNRIDEITKELQEKYPDNLVTSGKVFLDVWKNDWFYNAVHYVTNDEILESSSETTFSPMQRTTRATIVSMLYKASKGKNNDFDNRFDDVEKDKTYYDSIAWAKEHDIVKGYDINTFAPDDKLTREQTIAMLYRYAKYNKYDLSDNADLKRYIDHDDISDYAVTPIKWAVENGIIRGTSKTTLSAKKETTKAEIAEMFMNFMKKYGNTK